MVFFFLGSVIEVIAWNSNSVPDFVLNVGEAKLANVLHFRTLEHSTDSALFHYNKSASATGIVAGLSILNAHQDDADFHETLTFGARELGGAHLARGLYVPGQIATECNSCVFLAAIEALKE